MVRSRVLIAAAVVAAAIMSVALLAPAPVAQAAPSQGDRDHPGPAGRRCPPDGYALGYSDALDKLVIDGAMVGGLSDIAYDRRTHAYASTVDNHADDPARIWFYRDLAHPHVTGDPLVLRAPDGTAYTGETADNEGMTILPDGEFAVSSELEPSIRIFGRDGGQRASLPVPDRFRVAPAGEATDNATLEGMTSSRNGRRIVAAMEGTLSGDAPAAGAADYRRFLVYEGHRGHWALTKQVGYRVEDGNRIAEIAEYAPGKLLVLEAAWTADVGNTIELYAVTGLGRAADVSGIANLSTRPDAVMSKRLVADVTRCPSLGAPAKEAQINPLMDNYEAMTTGRMIGDVYRVTLMSDDNFGAQQTTRVLNLAVRLP